MNDTYTMIGLGLGGVVAVWLVFSILKKVVGFVFLAALAAGAYVVWTNPALLNGLIGAAQRSVG